MTAPRNPSHYLPWRPMTNVARVGRALAFAALVIGVYLLWAHASDTTAHDFSIALAAGVVGAVVWEILVGLRRWWRLRRHLRPALGNYDVFEKGTNAERLEKVSILGARENLLHVRMTRLGRGRLGHAETWIEMNESFPRNGRGLYEHVHPDTPVAFGWWDIQIRDATTIYVHTTFVNKQRGLTVEGAVWRKAE